MFSGARRERAYVQISRYDLKCNKRQRKRIKKFAKIRTFVIIVGTSLSTVGV